MSEKKERRNNKEKKNCNNLGCLAFHAISLCRNFASAEFADERTWEGTGSWATTAKLRDESRRAFDAFAWMLLVNRRTRFYDWSLSCESFESIRSRPPDSFEPPRAAFTNTSESFSSRYTGRRRRRPESRVGRNVIRLIIENYDLYEIQLLIVATHYRIISNRWLMQKCNPINDWKLRFIPFRILLDDSDPMNKKKVWYFINIIGYICKIFKSIVFMITKTSSLHRLENN